MQLDPLQDPVDTPEEAYREVLLPFGKFALAFLVVYLVGRFIVEPAANRIVRQRNPNNPTILDAFRRYLRLAVVVVGVAFGMAAGGYGQVLTNSTLIVAAATLAIGVAGQEVIGALISGLFLVVNPNFNVGDWIAWGDREGVVEAISFRTTRVRTENNETVTVPNTELTTSTIVSQYGRTEFRVSEEIGIAYDDDVEEAMSLLAEAATSHAAVMSDPEPRVYFSEFGDDELVLHVQFWIRNPTRKDILRVRSEFSLAVKSRFEAAGITISPASERELSGDLRVEQSAAGGADSADER
ncbi:mechanosensitive ion channel family protein [Halorussus gelatinilyticus]|uniref:Mechanosensitive ion channel family protein n=1 Tax=Halorussus gelatinilyticus TaxID=2937524 RepID=A0A8U0II48_9EURY|nr:mechanosensitive ion channel family protein [Halorussus gelatinilyticus]UPV99758.1 mechanosensitive ion channel family protein [Halorussus gelatinilyticus]